LNRGHQNFDEARNLEVGLAKGGSDTGKITEEGVFHHLAMPLKPPKNMHQPVVLLNERWIHDIHRRRGDLN
jgi:hypothetical protein